MQPRVNDWQSRRLDKVYPFVYMDALMVSIKGGTEGRTDRKSGKYAVYSIIGINCDGRKDCFGFWIGENGEPTNGLAYSTN